MLMNWLYNQKSDIYIINILNYNTGAMGNFEHNLTLHKIEYWDVYLDWYYFTQTHTEGLKVAEIK